MRDTQVNSTLSWLDLFGVKIKKLNHQFFSTEKNFGILIRMSFGGCFWALSFCVDWRNKTCFGKTTTKAKIKIGPLWSKIKKLGKKMFLWTKKSFSPKICVHWIKVVDQKSLNERYGPFIIIWRMSQLNVRPAIIWLCLHLYWRCWQLVIVVGPNITISRWWLGSITGQKRRAQNNDELTRFGYKTIQVGGETTFNEMQDKFGPSSWTNWLDYLSFWPGHR